VRVVTDNREQVAELLFKDQQGKAIFGLGVNYWPSSAALNMWTEWRPEEISDDIRRMRSLGMNCCRLFLYLPAFMPLPGRVDDVMLERLHYVLDQFAAAGLGALPTFIVGHMSGEDWDVSWRKGRNFITDPEVMAITRDYILQVVKDCRANPAISGWLLSNELPNYIGNQAADDVESWVRTMITAIRQEDPRRPVSIGDGAWSPEVLGKPSGFWLRKLNTIQNFVGLHYYPRGLSPWRHSFTTAFQLCLAREWQRPVIVEEFGTSTTLCSEKNQAHYYRTVFYSALINGAQGVLSWCLNDFDFTDRRPYSHHTYEERFGIVRADKSLKPAAAEFGRFARTLEKMALEKCSPLQAPAGLLIPSNYYYQYPYQFQPEFQEWYELYLETFCLLKRANLNVRMLFEPAQELGNDGCYSHELQLEPGETPVLFVPRMKVMTKPMRVKLERYVNDGGILYFSFANDSWVLDWHKLAGIEMDCKFGVPDFYPSDFLDVLVKEDWGDFKQGQQFRIPLLNNNPEYGYCRVISGSTRVILETRSGAPFLTERQLGRGKIYFCMFPIEMLALASQADEWKGDLGRIYRSIFNTTVSAAEFVIKGDGLELGVWQAGNRFELLIVNHAWESRNCLLTVNLPRWEIEQADKVYQKTGQNTLEILLECKEICHLTFIQP